MELLAPAGNLEKLRYGYRYGADAAYIGLKAFSLRAKADNFHEDEWREIKAIKGDRKLYGALNIYFHNRDLDRLEKDLPYLANYPLDAFIISDLGLVPILKREFPNIDLHLSTQANCVNREAAKMYRDLGFSRVVLGRELGLREIEGIKRAVPDLELEAFVHGAMCIAYSGRCLLSSVMADRSANQGNCSHSCRWSYRVLEEAERPGEYFPVVEGENFTTILSSKDLNMIRYLKDLRDAGVDSFKIEGRMKSIYYVAMVTRAYRKALDALDGVSVPRLEDFIEDLERVSHREYSTGFYLAKEDADEPTHRSYRRQFQFLGCLGEPMPEVPGAYRIDAKNKIRAKDTLQYVGPDVLSVDERAVRLYLASGEQVDELDHGKPGYIIPSVPVEPGYILRKPTLHDQA